MRNVIKKMLKENDFEWFDDALNVEYFPADYEMLEVGQKIIVDGNQLSEDTLILDSSYSMEKGTIISIRKHADNDIMLVKFDDWVYSGGGNIVSSSGGLWRGFENECANKKCWSFMVNNRKYEEDRELNYYLVNTNYKNRLKEEMTRKKLQMELPLSVSQMNRIFKENGHELYVVGGAVRDMLTGQEPKDFDLATDATPEKVKSMLSMFRTIDMGEQFAIVNVITEDGQYEIATFRTDIGKGRRPDSVEYTTIDQDVKRRDLTINALFYDIDKGEVVDLVGGVNDIENKVVRTVGLASERFDEDKLRILRALRFAARVGSELDKGIVDAISNDKTPVSGNGLSLSQERIRDEFLKGVKQAQSVGYFTQMIDKYGLWDWIFGRLVVTMDPLIETKNHVVLISTLLRNNDYKTIEKTLVERLKYTSDEGKQISFLIQFLGLNSTNAFKLREKFEVIRLDEDTLITFAEFNRMNMKLVNSFLKYKVSTSGDELLKQGFVGRGIGTEKERIEKEKFEKIMSESIKSVAYSAVVLTDKSRSDLLQYIKVPEGWESLAHHMTINMGPLKEEYKPLLGQPFDLLITHVGKSDNVLAVKVDTEFKTKNENPHITVAVDRYNGGKPALANQIIEWGGIYPFEVEGILKEITF